jgi:hypothetical protein
MRLLVLNCHEPWTYQLGILNAELDVVVDLPGRQVAGWDHRMRPLPAKARLLTLADALARHGAAWSAVICHSISDLLDTATIEAPKLLVLHDTVDGRLVQQGADFDKPQLIAMLHSYLELFGAQAIPVTAAKGESWGVAGQPLHCFADPVEYQVPSYGVAAGLRVANNVTSKRVFLAWDFHQAAFGELPVTLVGHNPDIGVEAARDWEALRRNFATHRFYIHTADPRFEDGFNMAMIEAMAAGLPVVSNAHPTSPLTHGVDGFLAATPQDARMYAERLLGDIDLARTMGAAARKTAWSRFAPRSFRAGIRDAIDLAGKKFRRRTRTLAAS